MATLFVDKVDPQSGTALEIGSSGDTITIPSGCTITNNGTQTGFGGVMTPYFLAYRNATYTISSGTWTKLVFDAEDFDTASGFNVSTGVYTVQTAGKYYFEYSVRSESQGGSATSSRQYAYLQRDRGGSATQRANPGLDFRNNYGTGGTLHGATILDCNANDTVEIYLYHATTSGSVTVVEGSYRPTYFLGYKIIE